MLEPREKHNNGKAELRRAEVATLGMLVAQVTGGLVAIGLVVNVVGTFEKGSVSWFLLLNWLGLFTMCLLAVFLTRELGKYSRSAILSVVGVDGELQAHTYVLYLRPFSIDNSLFKVGPVAGRASLTSFANLIGVRNTTESEATDEERVLRHFLRFGRVIGIGRPGETDPLPGAERFYLPKQDWKPEVSDAIKYARMVLIVAGIRSGESSAEGTLWEYAEAVRLLPPSRVLLLSCGDEDEYYRFRKAAADYFATRAAEFRRAGETFMPPPALPAYPSLRRPRKLRKALPLRGVIRFNADWTAEFVRFDPTTERGATHRARWRAAVRRQVDPLMEHLEQFLPGHATPAQEPSIWGTISKRLPLILFGWTWIVPGIISNEKLVTSQKITWIALVVLGTGSFLWNGIHVVRLVRRHRVRVTFSENSTS